MSTKAIREALAQLEGTPGYGEALAEVEAIERAAALRGELAEGVAEGDTAALERLAQLACDERNANLTHRHG